MSDCRIVNNYLNDEQNYGLRTSVKVLFLWEMLVRGRIKAILHYCRPVQKLLCIYYTEIVIIKKKTIFIHLINHKGLSYT